MSVAKVSEISATSSIGFEDAIKQGISRASKTLRNVKGAWIKEGAVVIDVGINRIADPNHPKGSRVVGDVDYEGIESVASAATPVPGGVGISTIAMLMYNVVNAARFANGLEAFEL